LPEGPGPTSSPGSLPALRVARRCSPVGFGRQHFFNKLRHDGRRILCEIPSRGLNQGKSPCVLVFALWKGRGRLTRALTNQSRGIIPRCPRTHPRHLVGGIHIIFSTPRIEAHQWKSCVGTLRLVPHEGDSFMIAFRYFLFSIKNLLTCFVFKLES
jgi:hypothetical protein